MKQYRIIDTHTHVFPDAIARKSMDALESVESVKAYGDGTLAGLKSSMEKSGVDLSLVLPVVTKPKQFESVNRFAAYLNTVPGIRSLAGIHPDCEGVDEKLDELKEAGFAGVKLHPDYQGRDIDHPGYIKILERLRDRGMIAVIHAGFDPAFPDHIHCPPDRSAPVVKALTGNGRPFIVLAHMGGLFQEELVLRHLVGLPVYFDTSYMLDKRPTETFLEILRAHGTDRVFFASDSPWTDVASYVSHFFSLPLTEEEREALLHGNAERFFGF